MATAGAVAGPSIECVAELGGHEERVWHASWSPNGQELATCSGDRSVRVWGLVAQKWTCTCTLDGVHTRTVRCCEWSPCGRMIAAAGFDASTSVWTRTSSGDFELATTLEGHENEVKGVAWSPGGDMLATCARDKTVWIWERDPDDEEFECVSVLGGHSQDVKAVVWHPSDNSLFSCSYDDTIRVWVEEDDDWRCAQVLTGHSSTVWQLAFSPCGTRLVSCSDDRSLAVWQRHKEPTADGAAPFTWKRLATIADRHSRTPLTVSWSTRGVIASAGSDNAISLVVEGTDPSADGAPTYTPLLRHPNAHDRDINDVAWHPRRPELFATVGDDCKVRLWLLHADDAPEVAAPSTAT